MTPTYKPTINLLDVMHSVDSFIADIKEAPGHTSVIFTLKQKPGALAEILKLFQEKELNINHIESRPSTSYPGSYEILIQFADDEKKDDILEIVNICKKHSTSLKTYDFNTHKRLNSESAPWFPRKIVDINQFANRILSYGAELDADHPGFTDEVYRARRKQFADIAFNYRHGEKIPYIDYTEQEIGAWRTIYTELVKLYPTHACKEFNYIFPLLQQNCGYGPDKIPQLQDVSDFLKDCTGFILRPVAGLLSSRDFLAGLAFRVFHSTQYIRHHSVPMYTPEPDICHELLGHAPLFADPDFAKFSQEIGLASLGASDEMIEKLATLYWFTVEYGVCLENNQKKAYGAGLLSSFGELQYCLTDEPEIVPFEPSVCCVTKYPITKFQPKYFLAESFNDASNKLKEWASTIPKDFQVRYNPYTQSVEVLEDLHAVKILVRDIKSDLSTLENAISKLE
uniref:phenylalanine 4-monooxygenase n=1 Tax=Strongyloides papillosus TaxID=174720 RepID=A0A0N5C9T5_STREA